MKSPRSSVVFVCLLVWIPCSIVYGQAAAEAQKAAALYAQAVGLHPEEKYADAQARVKEAVALAPQNARYQDYLKQLAAVTGKQQLDQHALQASAEAEQTVASLAAYLVKGARTDEDKARLIFRWIADRIAYDYEGFRAGKPGDNSPEGVLKNRKCVCAGYSSLYEALAKAAGLEVVKISGFSKGASYAPGRKPENHAWNAVKLNGRWQLLDATWGAGDADAKGFRKRFKEYHFLMAPEEFVLTHLPRDPQWQLLTPLVTTEEFESWPQVKGAFFRYGFSVADIRQRLQVKDFRELVDVLDVPAGPKITILQAPIIRRLKAGEKYKFRIDAPRFQSMAISNGPKPVRMTGSDGVFEAEATAEKGTMVIGGLPVNSTGKSYTGVLRYEVE